jgi:hypothetical protein
MCTAMLYDPVEKAKELELKKQHEAKAENFWGRDLRNDNKVFDRWVRFKQFVLLKGWKKKEDEGVVKRNSFLSFLFFW